MVTVLLLIFICFIVVQFDIQEVSERWIGKSIDMLKNDPFRPLSNQLQHHGLLTERYRFILFLLLLSLMYGVMR